VRPSLLKGWRAVIGKGPSVGFTESRAVARFESSRVNNMGGKPGFTPGTLQNDPAISIKYFDIPLLQLFCDVSFYSHGNCRRGSLKLDR
jgi:hypothetical protein